MKNIRVGEPFTLTQQFGFNDLEAFNLFEIWLEQEQFKFTVDRITACYQVNVFVDDFSDAAKVETYLYTHP